MTNNDDDLLRLERDGMPSLPDGKEGAIEFEGARIWFASYGAGPPVILLHGGMGNSGDWSLLVRELVSRNYCVVVIDSRGQGRSTWDGQPFSYRQMASDVRAVLDHLRIAEVAIVGWSDGADTGLVLADATPERVAALFFFACDVDLSGAKPFKMTPVVDRMLSHNKREYAALSPTPGSFETVFAALQIMQSTQPSFSREQLAGIDVPVVVCFGEHDEFIKRSHLEYVARSLPNAKFVALPDVSHFAPLQRPAVFNGAVLDFLRDVGWSSASSDRFDRDDQHRHEQGQSQCPDSSYPFIAQMGLIRPS